MKNRTEFEAFKRKRNQQGFTLVEILTVVAIIGLFATITVPSFAKAHTRSMGVRVAMDMRTFGDAFVVYAAENGRYPPDSHGVLLDGADMEDYLDEWNWYTDTAIGGNYKWDGSDGYPYAGVSVFGHAVSDAELIEIDEAIDDDDLTTGSYRKTPNGRFT